MSVSLRDRRRFDLRKTADCFVAPLMDCVEQRLAESSKSLLVKACYDSDLFMITVDDRTEEFEIPVCDFLERINELGGIDIDFIIEQRKHLEIDGTYCFDRDLDSSENDAPDVGIVCIWLYLPPGQLENSMIADIKRSLRGHIVHELQHVVQRLFYGSNYKENNTIEYHIDDIDEIDARLEEIIAMEDENSTVEQNIATFGICLKRYAEQYLMRNDVTVDLPSYALLYDKIIENHMTAYREKFLTGEDSAC